jgi:SAM-dependent methyltransferase
MKRSLLRLLACPSCGGDVDCDGSSDPVETGELRCAGCDTRYPISGGIPRFVDSDDYAASFGLQWNLFRREQLDSDNRATLSRDRFLGEIGLGPEELKRMCILEAGCGAGRFLEIASAHGAEVVGVDISRAADAAAVTVRGRENAHVVQASITALPFKAGVFDLCYSIGVMQHTPDPARSIEALPRVVRPGGHLALTVYERKPWTRFNGKYLVRTVTRRLPPRVLLPIVTVAATVLFPVTELLFRLPVVGRAFAFVIPIADYTGIMGLTFGQRYRAVVLDTFDMLSPAYDQPLTFNEVRQALTRAGVASVRRHTGGGLNVVGNVA